MANIIYDRWYGDITRYIIGESEGRYFFAWTDRDHDSIEGILAREDSTADRGIEWHNTLGEAVQAARNNFKDLRDTTDDPGGWQELIDALPTIRKTISSENLLKGIGRFDLGKEGDFEAFEYEVLSPNTARFYGIYTPIEGEPQKASIYVLFYDDISDLDEEDLLRAGWMESHLEGVPPQDPS